MYTRIEWCKDFLYQLGNVQPSSQVLNWVDGWTVLESSPPGAMYNLLNTTQTMPGSTPFNSVGVQNFVSFSQGIEANIIVLRNGFYPTLNDALTKNDFNLLSSPDVAKELNTWCGGCNYASAIPNVSGTKTQDQFPGVDTVSFIEQAAHDTWFSNKMNLPYTTGIAGSWRYHYVSGRNMAPANGPEFNTVRWDGTPIIAQMFGPDRCEWYNGTPYWYKVGL